MNDTKPLWEHQRKAIAWAETRPELALFYDVGTGKTRTIIEIARRKYAANSGLLRTIILCPKIVCSNWKREFLAYSKISSRDIIILKGSATQRLKEFREKCFVDRKPIAKIIITNYEAMEMDTLFSELMLWNPELFAGDESHRCKSIKSKRAQKVAILSERARYRYILTGTPILNSAMDLFQQFVILDGGKTFGKNFYAFRGKYFEDENSSWAGKQGYFPKFAPRPEAYWELSQAIASKSLTVKRAECLDLPPFVHKTIEVELSPEQRRLYTQMRDDYITYIKSLDGQSDAVVASLAVTKSLRMQQIVFGFAKTDTGATVSLESTPRVAALTELLEDLTPHHKVIVWAVFKENYERIRGICKTLGVQSAEIHGDIKDKDAEIAKWRDPKTRVLIANQGAGGIGINLVESDVSIYFSKNFSLDHDYQSEARNFRAGSEIHEKVTRIDLVAPDTIDELINEVLVNKEQIGNKILEWTKKEKEKK